MRVSTLVPHGVVPVEVADPDHLMVTILHPVSGDCLQVCVQLGEVHGMRTVVIYIVQMNGSNIAV